MSSAHASWTRKVDHFFRGVLAFAILIILLFLIVTSSIGIFLEDMSENLAKVLRAMADSLLDEKEEK